MLFHGTGGLLSCRVTYAVVWCGCTESTLLSSTDTGAFALCSIVLLHGADDFGEGDL